MIKARSHNILRILRNSLVTRYFFHYFPIFAIVFALLSSAQVNAETLHIEIIALFEKVWTKQDFEESLGKSEEISLKVLAHNNLIGRIIGKQVRSIAIPIQPLCSFVV